MPRSRSAGRRVFLSDEHPEMGIVSPETLHGTSVGLHLLVEDADATFNRAIAAGAKQLSPLEDEPWGQRSGSLQDPFGHRWYVTQRTAELSPKDMDTIGKAAGFKTLRVIPTRVFPIPSTMGGVGLGPQ